MDNLIHMVDGVMGNPDAAPLPPERRGGAFILMLEALRSALPILQEDLNICERSYLPEPTEYESSEMAIIANAVNQIKAAIVAAEARR